MKGLRSYLIGSAIVLVLYLVAQYYKPQPTDWNPTYLKEDKIPFGLYILDHQLEDLFPGTALKTSRLPVFNTLKDKHFKNTSYVFIAGKLKLDELDYKELIRFLREGNQVFIATYDLGKILQKGLKIKIQTHMSFDEKIKVPVSFVNPALDANHYYFLNKGLGQQYFSLLDTVRAVALGKNKKGEINFVKYNIGKGSLYILPNPQLLSNYNLIDPAGAEYAAKALSYLPASGAMILDENNTRGNISNTAILRVIFDHPPLAWAYIIAVGGLLLFVFFEMKRRQRIIPVIDPLINSSVEFVKVVGKVYYQQRDNRDIAEKKISYFLAYIRTAYRLKTMHTDAELAAAIIAQSGASEETVTELFKAINAINNKGKLSDNQLINLNKLIEKFHKQVQ